MSTSIAQPAGHPSRPADRVALRVPADAAYLAVLRTATAGLAARLDLTLDEIEDLRIAVDEACALLLANAPGGEEQLTAVFGLDSDALDVQVNGPAAELPEPGSIAWAVLEALAGEVETGSGHDGSWIRLRHRRLERDGRRRATGANP